MTRPGWENTCEHGLDLASCSKCQVAAAIAAAEERRRRAGIEERDELRAALRNHVEYLRGLRTEIDDEICPDGAHIEWCSDITRSIVALNAALAPRDSGKVIASGHAEETDREDRRDDRWANPDLEDRK